MSNKYCQALVELRNKPAHELKEVGDQWRTPDNIFWGINTLFGPFVLDLFTDGDNAKCAAYYTAEDNALAHDWSERLAELKGAAFGSRWRIEQCSELSAVSASFVLSTPTETDGAVFPGRIMLANTCTWTYRGDECGYHGPAVADEYDQPTSDITKDKCSKCLSGCKFRNNVGNFGGFLSINKLSQ
ncbi:phage minor tail protein L [Escherichia coli]|uniref:phage minor tail protein L n=1 Tax=Escherichia coli TaxID=562 RepID=UPI003D79B999